jgi:acetate kinase
MSQSQNIRRMITVNSGSSSLKVALYELGGNVTQVLTAKFERLGDPEGQLRIQDARGAVLVNRKGHYPDHGCALDEFLQWLRRQRPDLEIHAVGHRLVHGGIHYCEPQRVTPEMMATLNSLIPMDPDHMPQAIQAIQVITRDDPSLLQVACFDTAFHRRMPRIAQIYAIPQHFERLGVIRFGFHGLSYEYIMQKLRSESPIEADGRVIIAHLGNGASMAAVQGGQCRDTTMGFTPNAGLVMGTRSGDIDPGVIIHLLTKCGMTPESLDEVLNRRSGLLGVSGSSGDMRDLLENESTDPRASEAVTLFCYQAKKHLAAMVAVLGGVDTLIFTGGIGERSAEVRQRICAGMEFLGIELEARFNATSEGIISFESSQVKVRVMKTDEECIIAQAVSQFLGS